MLFQLIPNAKQIKKAEVAVSRHEARGERILSILFL